MKATILFVAAALAGAAVFAAGKTDAAYPAKPVSIIVPYGAGGTTDLAARQFAAVMKKYLGQAVTVTNQPGSSSAIGTKTVYDAPADGYTLLFSADTLFTLRIMGLSPLSMNDFTPITPVTSDPKVIVVKKGSKYTSLKALFDDIAARPGKVKMSYTGPGGSGHVQALIYGKFGMDIALTAYSSGADGIVAVLGNQVDFTNSNYSTVTPYLESGDLVLLGISEENRMPSYAAVPTVGDVIPAAKPYMAQPFSPLSLVVKKGTPEGIVETLRIAAKKTTEDSEWKTYVKANNLDELYLKYPTPAEAAKFYADFESYLGYLIYDAGAAKESPEKFGIPRVK